MELKVKKVKKPHFRSLVFVGECNHKIEQVTSMYRMHKGREACLIGDFCASGLWCRICKATVQPVKYLGLFRVIENGR